MPDVSIQTSESIPVSAYINTYLVMHHLLLSSERAGVETKDIIKYAQHLGNTNHMHEFESFLASFEEWISK
tara:strand:+ start:124 stop:336 length:213 start_codon:yes stop_codon:yes gene_type:complete